MPLREKDVWGNILGYARSVVFFLLERSGFEQPGTVPGVWS